MDLLFGVAVLMFLIVLIIILMNMDRNFARITDNLAHIAESIRKSTEKK
ncbi:MAG: hypothetical protein Q7R84_00685 [bacterium]|nr:hypothetical protein [bacterium]